MLKIIENPFTGYQEITVRYQDSEVELIITDSGISIAIGTKPLGQVINGQFELYETEDFGNVREGTFELD